VSRGDEVEDGTLDRCRRLESTVFEPDTQSLVGDKIGEPSG
jgi:hypothetical protein